jgi:hypothetical protein
MIPFTGNPDLIAQGVIQVPNFTKGANPMEPKRKAAFFKALSVL